MAALDAALSHLIDYAGLFPPAGLPLDQVVGDFAAYRRSPDAWMLGRLVVPVARLDELLAASRDLAIEHGPWPVSALVASPEAAAADEEKITAFNQAVKRRWRVEAVECPVTTAAEVRIVAARFRGLDRFVEVPAEPDPQPFVEAIAAAGVLAKIRTGGVTADRIPPAPAVARFLARCHAARVACKATAGLHHALRGTHALTYEEGSDSAPMHGFVNVVMAAACLKAGLVDEAGAASILEETSPDRFRFGGRAAAWGDLMIPTGDLDFARRALLRSVGSCSFEEPVAEIEAWR